LTNANTTEYFQTVGHGDLFQDASGNWWGIALATCSSPAWENYPMGRETVMYPVTWAKGQWPVLEPVRGKMSGWALPRVDRHIKGDGAFNSEPDRYDFAPGSSIPLHFVHWRFPSTGSYTISPPGHPDTLRLTPSVSNLTGTSPDAVPAGGITFISRRQTDTLFTYSVDISFAPSVDEEEAGVTVFLNQNQHLDLGIIQLPGFKSPSFRFRTAGVGNDKSTLPEAVVKAIPQSWGGGKITLSIQAVNETFYAFHAAPSNNALKTLVLGYAPATIVSGGTGPFTGTLMNVLNRDWQTNSLTAGALVGAYASSNGGKGTTPAYLSRWRYTGQGQDIGDGRLIR
jgi:beta-xylosidase